MHCASTRRPVCGLLFGTQVLECLDKAPVNVPW